MKFTSPLTAVSVVKNNMEEGWNFHSPSLIFYRVFTVMGECPFHLGQGKSGKLAIVRGKERPRTVGQGKMLFCSSGKYLMLLVYDFLSFSFHFAI